MAGTHALYVPEIVTGGFLYRCYPPLYRVDSKERPFIGNKMELVQLYMNAVIRLYKIRIGGDYMKEDEFTAYLCDTADYRFIMTEMLQPFYKISVELIETIAASLVINGGVDTRGNDPVLVSGILQKPEFIRDFMKVIQTRFPETEFNNGTVQGIANGVKGSIHINDRFVAKIEQLIPIYEKYGFIIGMKEKGCEDRMMTILEFCNHTQSLTPAIITRFKGLGECNPEQLWETVLDPSKRLLVQLTMDSIERDLEIFRKLKSDKPIYAKQRAEMVERYKIRYEDLDN